MTYIEFFDDDAIENICSCLVSVPERVIMVGDDEAKMADHAKRYTEFFTSRKENVQFLCRTFDCTDLSDIVDKLKDLIEEYPDCSFDLTGGSDLLLVAIGIACRDTDIHLHRFDLRENKLYDCDCDGRLISVDSLPELTVEELVALYGGRVMHSSDKPSPYRWKWSPGFADDIEYMWEVCSRDVRGWNMLMSVLSFVDKQNLTGSSLTVTVSNSLINKFMEEHNCDPVKVKKAFEALQRIKIITNVYEHGSALRFSYKNEQIKSVLLKAGQELELKITMTALRAKDENGELIYNEVRNGVFINWDGSPKSVANGPNTKNEVDVVMTRGVTGVFVSCKNGNCSIDELYKLSIVAGQFGGKYAKKALVISSLYEESPFTENLLLRAKEMDIKVIVNPQSLSRAELNDVIGSLWQTETEIE